jgi:hypothetical protein
LGLSGPVPRRVEAATKAGMLELIDAATAAGWEYRRACAYLQLGEARAWRWHERRAAGCLQDRAAGGHAVHGLLEAEQEEILALFDEWGEIDGSHRKLAHRGSWTARVLGLAILGDARSGCTRAHAARAAAARALGAAAVSGVGELPEELDLDL